MISQDGGCTAAFESERFPYFTINKPRQSLEKSSSSNEILAFFERAKFNRAHKRALELMEVVVTSDHQYQVRDDDSLQALACWLVCVYECEWLEWEDPWVIPWEVTRLYCFKEE